MKHPVVPLIQKLLRISDAFALVKEVWDRVESLFIIKVAHSIVSSQSSWLKVVISLLEMELEESQSTE